MRESETYRICGVMELWKYSTEVSFGEFDWLYLFWGRVVSTVECESVDVSCGVDVLAV